MAIEFYKEFGELGYLANYSNHGFWLDNVYYPTAEHYYQSQKFNNVEIQKKIIMAKTPKEASEIGRSRNLKRKNNFKDIKNDVMYTAVLEKFRQNPDIRSKLIETRNEEIKEMTVKESYWGVGPNFDGDNHYGKILMKVREQVKNDLLDNIIKSCKGKTVYVIGHRQPDADSVFSSCLLATILKKVGIHAIFSVRDDNFVNDKMIRDFLKESYEVITDYSDKYFLLVDHNSLDGIPEEHVLGAFDHHIITGEIKNLIEEETASCGLLLYELFKDRVSFDLSMKQMVGLSVLTDTEYLSSSRFSDDDKLLYNDLNLSFDENQLQKKYFETTDFSHSISDNFKDNYKSYTFHDEVIHRSMISGYTKDKEMYYSQYVMEMEKNDIQLLIWCDYDKHITYVVYHGEEFIYPTFTTSTNLVLNYLDQEKKLIL